VRVRGIGWLGTRTQSFDEMVGFAEHVLGLRRAAYESGMAVFELANGDVFEVFSPDHDGGGHPEDAVVAGFLVDDVATACKGAPCSRVRSR
jgi:hypothetical protein